MTSKVPAVSVLLPTYNGAKTLHRAILSIIQQSFQDWELIIVDDGSTDETSNVISSFSDRRIRSIKHEDNRGLVQALRTGTELCTAPLIARQDQDDVSHKDRLLIQTSYLIEHPEIGIVGTWAEVVDEFKNEKQNIVKHLRHPRHHGNIRWLVLFNSPFVHSSVVIRREILESLGGYSETSLLTPPEDYELWSRLLNTYLAANIPQYLLVYQQTASGMSSKQGRKIQENAHRIALGNISELMSRPTSHLDLLCIHVMNGSYQSKIKVSESFKIDAQMFKYHRQFRKHQIRPTYLILLKSIIRNHLVCLQSLVVRLK